MSDTWRGKNEDQWHFLFTWWRVDLDAAHRDLVKMTLMGEPKERLRKQAKKCRAIADGYAKVLFDCPF
jgi:hypothetical protein